MATVVGSGVLRAGWLAGCDVGMDGCGSDIRRGVNISCGDCCSDIRRSGLMRHAASRDLGMRRCARRMLGHHVRRLRGRGHRLSHLQLKPEHQLKSQQHESHCFR